MTRPVLSRAHLEALVIAAAGVHADHAMWLYDNVQPGALSAAARTLLRQFADPTIRVVRGATKAQDEVLDRAGAVPIRELAAHTAAELLENLHALPPQAAPRTSALDVGTETAA